MANVYDNSLNTVRISEEMYADYEAARSGFFTLIVDNLDNLIKPTFTGDADEAENNDKITRAQEYLKLNVVKSSVPSFSVETLSYKRGNEVVKFAGVPTFNDGSITVDDVVGLNTKDILYAWLYLAYNPQTRKGGRMKDYKKTCTLCEYTQDYEKIREWTLYGCFITEIDDAEFNKEADDKRQLTAKLVFDRAVMNDISEVNV